MRAILAGLCALAMTPARAAEDRASFWHGKTVTILIGGSVGGGFDACARRSGQVAASEPQCKPTKDDSTHAQYRRYPRP